MRSLHRRLPAYLLALACATIAAPADAQTRITTPAEEFGKNFGDDYFLANYQQLSAYWRKLDAQSDRMVLQEIGKTAEGRPHLMAIVTSPENHRNLARYKDISMRLALAQGLSDDQARALAREGKAVVWIDGGLHASEVLGAQQLGEMVYQMVSRTDPETMRLLDEVVILFVHANPDGHDLVADWYMRHPNERDRSTGGVPRLYQKYIGHDNNRDFFMSTQAETENINRVLYHEWMPQVLYNHHQSGPAGTVFWSPPLRDPYNYNLDPIVLLGYQALGAAMHSRMAAEGKPGATMRSGGPYDGWWNGGIRNTASFHNVIALLTEMIGNPTPMRIPLVVQRQLPSADQAFPIPPQEWHFRQSVDYSISLNRAVLDYAARMRENLLYNIYAAGRRAIERGSRDHWTPNPKRYAALAQQLGQTGGRGGRGGADPARDMAAWAELHEAELRDPRGYIIPADQPDFPTATKFINALREVNVAVQRATTAFTVNGKSYPAGSYVVKTAQAFRPHVIDMFEPQVHPDVFPIPGGPPTPPYDNAGWTLALQMGVRFDRILEGFDCPCAPITEWNARPPAGRVTTTAGATGFVTSRQVNDAFVAANRLLAGGEEIWSLRTPLSSGGVTHPAGTLYIRSKGSTRRALDSLAVQLGVSFTGVNARPPANAMRLRPARVGLWDQYGGSMDAGWARWILEQYEFPFERIFPQQLNAGRLNERFDVLVFVGGAIPATGSTAGGGRGGRGGGPSPQDVPAVYRPHLGRVSADSTLPQIRAFLESGGTVVAIGSSAPNLAAFLQLPVEDHLVENGRPLPQATFYTPGSVLQARFDTTHPVAQGMSERTAVFFDDSPVFRLTPSAETAGVRRIGWFDTARPLLSGWSWGESYLENGVVAFEARVGRGKALFFGPEILKRAQPHGTFKLLFNAIQGSVAAAPD
ncbi:MAG TPA: M14 metallopeptidase family protein [Gemmatimonadaceae bacterium]|nr:M14 metallopeptidase family protein [Gemmatimonadaceae bacterium]